MDTLKDVVEYMDDALSRGDNIGDVSLQILEDLKKILKEQQLKDEFLQTEVRPLLEYLSNPKKYIDKYKYKDYLTDMDWEFWLRGRADFMLRQHPRWFEAKKPIDSSPES